MYMHDKMNKARGVIYAIGFVVAAGFLVWKLIVR